jgi:hypothetical protein
MQDYKNLQLPSRCLVYKGKNPGDIKVRPIKGKDEKLIVSFGREEFTRRFFELLKNNGILQGIDPVELTVGDSRYVLLWLILQTNPRDFTQEISCEGCRQLIRVDVCLSTLDSYDLPDDFCEPYTIKFSNGDKIGLRLFRVEDELKIEERKQTSEDWWLFRWALCMVDERNIDERIAYLNEFDVKDLSKIRAFHSKFFHGPAMEARVECSVCETQKFAEVPFCPEMIFPANKTRPAHTRRVINDRG